MIRHHLAGAAVSLALLLAMPAQAQTAAQPAQPDIPQSYLEAGRDVVILSGLAESFEAIYLEFRERVTQTVGTTRPEVRKDMEQVIEDLRPEAEKKRQEIIASAAYIFAKRMSEADLKEVAAFFRSPVGQRYNAMRPRAIDEIFALLQPWSLQTSNFLFDRVESFLVWPECHSRRRHFTKYTAMIRNVHSHAKGKYWKYSLRPTSPRPLHR
ncbi:MAG: DUF2059 domain-containing protein, partial [Hyphomicrobiales bacterium]